jgi:hypothetical protein
MSNELKINGNCEIVAWDLEGLKVKHADVVEALTASDLDPKIARALLPRHAFARACRELSEHRIIRQVDESKNAIYFQFTAERKEGEQFSYTIETILVLDKETGRITSSNDELSALATAALDQAISNRTTSDITRLVQRILETQVDLFRFRKGGGAYLVPAIQIGVIDKVDNFLKRLGGSLNRFPIAVGSEHGDRSVKQAVQRGIAELIEDHKSAIDSFDLTTRNRTIEAQAEKINNTKLKLEGYACYLDVAREELETALAEAQEELRQKISRLTAEREEAERIASEQPVVSTAPEDNPADDVEPTKEEWEESVPEPIHEEEGWTGFGTKAEVEADRQLAVA